MLEDAIIEVLSNEALSSDQPDRDDEIDQFQRYNIISRVSRRSIDCKPDSFINADLTCILLYGLYVEYGL